MHRIRVRYTKEGRVRFVSARDLTSVWERALRRVDLPIAYSEGFHPHAKVSFPDALPVGYASTGEYAELTFAAPVAPGRDLGRLSATLPRGMDVLTYLEVPDGAPKLARMLPATLWEIVFAGGDDADVHALHAALTHAARELLACARRDVVRPRHGADDLVVDVRRPLLDIAVFHRREGPGPDDAAPVLRAVLRNDGPTVRPTELLDALRTTVDLPRPRLYRRVAQGEPVDHGLREALTTEVVALDPTRSAEAA